MLAIILISSLLISAYGIPLDAEEPKSQIQEQPQLAIKENAPKEILAVQEIEQPQLGEEPVVDAGGAAPLPSDISDSSDGNPVNQPDTSDLNTDATFWGWGYRRPFYGYRSYYTPWRRYGWGRGYGGWGRGYGGWGRGWRSYYW